MTLSRRGFLKTMAALGVAAGVPSALRSGSAPAPPSASETAASEQGLPALVADGSPTGTVVRLDRLSPDGAVAHASPAPANPPPGASEDTGGHRWVMVIDLAKCDGCGACMEACSAMHFIPPEQEWIKVYNMKDNPKSEAYPFPRPCMQCDNPPCVKVCPVSATWKREDGIVIQDTSRCIGCRFCIAACPYGARSFNWVEPPHTEEELSQEYSTDWNYPHRKGTTEKCIFCPGLLKEGKLPACSAGCPMGAIYFGDELEDAATNSQGETVRLSKLLEENAAYRHMEELGTEPRVYYLPPRGRVYGARTLGGADVAQEGEISGEAREA